MRIDALYNQFNSEYNTHQFGFFRPVADFVPAVHEVSLDLFNRLCGAAPSSQKVQDWLRPFLKSANVAVTATRQNADMVPYPSGYEYFASCRIVLASDGSGERACASKECECVGFDPALSDFFPPDTSTVEERPVTLVTSGKWAAVTSHVTKRPTLRRPYIKQVSDGFDILPKGIGVVILDYYRLPVEPIFNYTAVPNGADVYLQYIENGSRHLEWSDALMPVFLYQLGKRYGLTVSNQLILQVKNIDKIFE